MGSVKQQMGDAHQVKIVAHSQAMGLLVMEPNVVKSWEVAVPPQQSRRCRRILALHVAQQV